MEEFQDQSKKYVDMEDAEAARSLNQLKPPDKTHELGNSNRNKVYEGHYGNHAPLNTTLLHIYRETTHI